MRTSVEVDADGNVHSVHRGHGPPPRGFVELTDPTCCDRVMEDPRRYAIERRKGGRVGRTRAKHRIWVGLDDAAFLCDGKDEAIVTVGNLPEGADGTWFHVNGKALFVPAGETLEIASEEPGLWIVDLKDSRYWCTRERFTIRGIPDTEANRQMLQAAYDDPGGLRARSGLEPEPRGLGPGNRRASPVEGAEEG